MEASSVRKKVTVVFVDTSGAYRGRVGQLDRARAEKEGAVGRAMIAQPIVIPIWSQQIVESLHACMHGMLLARFTARTQVLRRRKPQSRATAETSNRE